MDHKNEMKGDQRQNFGKLSTQRKQKETEGGRGGIVTENYEVEPE